MRGCNTSVRFQHTAARRRLPGDDRPYACLALLFQHTAARRRLHDFYAHRWQITLVSTHSRPKAAAASLTAFFGGTKFQHTAARRRLPAQPASIESKDASFNTQPPEGGCHLCIRLGHVIVTFQHTAARRRLPAARRHARSD